MYTASEEQTWLHFLVALLKLRLRRIGQAVQPTEALQHRYAERHQEATRVKGHTLQQVPVIDELLKEESIEQKW
ncbi:hypothetical protein DPMN_170048 [Dreissena polymorpha]|uniref:Uncharacterized protein n=1 Tax=Dreissena polymorpha TaxID=45954 RepID=A0A9D4IDX5_DREPO|nr:hypothetical protein DPMN_170048 [Dreissena polymorpha]